MPGSALGRLTLSESRLEQEGGSLHPQSGRSRDGQRVPMPASWQWAPQTGFTGSGSGSARSNSGRCAFLCSEGGNVGVVQKKCRMHKQTIFSRVFPQTKSQILINIPNQKPRRPWVFKTTKPDPHLPYLLVTSPSHPTPPPPLHPPPFFPQRWSYRGDPCCHY